MPHHRALFSVVIYVKLSIISFNEQGLWDRLSFLHPIPESNVVFTCVLLVTVRIFIRNFWLSWFIYSVFFIAFVHLLQRWRSPNAIRVWHNDCIHKYITTTFSLLTIPLCYLNSTGLRPSCKAFHTRKPKISTREL